MCVSVCVYIYVYIHIYTYIYIRIYVYYLSLFSWRGGHPLLYVSLYISIYLYLSLSIHLCLYLYLSIHLSIYICTCLPVSVWPARGPPPPLCSGRHAACGCWASSRVGWARTRPVPARKSKRSRSPCRANNKTKM